MATSAFFKTGFDHFEGVEKKVAEAEAEREKNGGNVGKYPFYLKDENETARIIFLTCDQQGSDVPIIEQHNIQLPNEKGEMKYGNTFTCLKVIGQECPLCNAGDRPQTVGFLLVIDRRVVPSRKDAGKSYTDQLRIFPAKFGALKNLKRIALAKQNGLKGTEFMVSRSTNNAPNCGDQFSKEDQHDAAAVKALLKGKKLSEALGAPSVVAFWENYLACKSAADLATLVSQKQTGTLAPATQAAVAKVGGTQTVPEGNVNFDD